MEIFWEWNPTYSKTPTNHCGIKPLRTIAMSFLTVFKSPNTKTLKFTRRKATEEGPVEEAVFVKVGESDYDFWHDWATTKGLLWVLFAATMQAWTNQLIISQMEGYISMSQHITLQFVG